MRKKADHLLDFLSEKNNTKDLLSHWQSSAASHASPSHSTAAPVPPPTAPRQDPAPSPAPASHGAPTNEQAVSASAPWPQWHALRRQRESALVFRNLDAKLADAEREPHADHDLSTALDVLRQVPSHGEDPLSVALQHPPRSVQQLWWAACGSHAMICAGMPDIPYAGDGTPSPGPSSVPAKGYESRLPQQRPGLPRLMAKNIRTLQRLHRTHRKFFQLAEAVELEVPVPASLGAESSSEDEAEIPVGPTYTPSAPYPRLTAAYAHAQTSWQVQTILAHAGFEGSHAGAVQVLTDVATDYMMSLARTLRLYLDRFSHRFEPADLVELVLAGRGSGLATLETYVTHDIERYGQRLQEWHRKLRNSLQDQLQMLGGTVEDDDLLAQDGEALALGHFAAGVGDDFFGFKELGLDEELGVQHLAVPSRLFFGNRTALKTHVGHDHDATPTYDSPSPPIPLSRAAISAQIGLLRPWYLAQLGSRAVLEDETPERPRYKVPTNGKLPLHSMVYDDARRSSKAAAKRKRTAP